MSDDIKKDDVNPDAEFESLDDFLNDEGHEDDAFSLDDDDFDYQEQPQKKGGFGKFLGYTALIALLGGGAYMGYQYAPQLMGTSELSDFEKNMMQRANNFSEDLVAPVADEQTVGEADLNEIPMPNAADSNSNPELDVVMLEETDEASPEISISDVDVTIVPEDEPLPDDVAAMIGENTQGSSVVIVEDEGETQTAATIAEALELANSASAEEAVESKVDQEIAESFDKDFPVEDMPTEAVTIVEEENVLPSSFQRIPASPMDSEVSTDLPADAMVEVETVQSVDSKTLLVTEDPKDAVVVVENNADNEGSETSVNGLDEVAEDDIETIVDVTDALPNVTEDTIEDISIVETVDMPKTQAKSQDEPENKPVLSATDASEEETPDVQEEDVVIAKTPSAPKVNNPVKKVEVKKVVKKAPAPVVEKYSIDNAEQLNATVHPQVVEGQKALAMGDFDAANRIFNSVLASNPSNVHALTGKQMAVSKIAVPMPKTVETATQEQVTKPQASVQGIIAAPVPPKSVTSLPSIGAQVIAPADSIDAALMQMNTNPRDANAAITLANAYKAQGQTGKAIEWYQKALQLDALYKTGINRMAVYDALAGLQ